MEPNVFIKRIKKNVSIANVALDVGLAIEDSRAEMATSHDKHLVEIKAGALQTDALLLDTLSGNTDLKEAI